MNDDRATAEAADIVICVHNSPADVGRCLETSLASLGPADRLIVVDDGSAAETQAICQGFADRAPGRVVLQRHEASTGFCRAANAGLRASSAPVVVLLNSDTAVLRDWLTRLRTALHINPSVGVAGPLSNAGGWQSIPDLGPGGPPNTPIRDDAATLEAIQSYCQRLATRFDYPILEQVNGFCLAIRRQVLDTIGLLDDTHFPMGYGEEVDFNIRAQEAGFLCIAAIDCFVYHAKTKSYSTQTRDRLIAEGRTNLDRLHGVDRVRAAVKGCKEHPTLMAIRAEAAKTFADKGWILPFLK